MARRRTRKRVFQVTLQIEADDEFVVRNIAQRAFGAAYATPSVDVRALTLVEVTGGKHKTLTTMMECSEDEAEEPKAGGESVGGG